MVARTVVPTVYTTAAPPPPGSAVIALLASRGVPIDRRERDRIVGERDPARLERWIVRAIACTSVAELISEP